MKHASQLSSILIQTIVVGIITYIVMVFLYSTWDTGSPHQQERVANRTRIIFSTWWDTDNTLNNTDNLQSTVDTIIEETHPIASTTDGFTTLCSTHKTRCDRTRFTSVLNDKQRLYYQTLIAYVTQKITSMGLPLADYIDTIEINSSNVKSRWYSSRNSIVLDVKSMKSYQEFIQVLIHEIGHIVDFTHLIGDPLTSKDTTFTEFGRAVFFVDDPSLVFYAYSRSDEYTRAQNTSYKDFVSGYGMTDPFEDLAESINFYMYYHHIFKRLSSQSNVLLLKYQFLEELFGGRYINDGLKKASLFSSDKWEYRPYDTTRF